MKSMDLKMSSKLHDNIVSALKARLDLSEREMDQRFQSWRRDEENMIAYIPERDADDLRREQRGDGIPQFTTIEVPVSYAMMMAAHTYFTSVFLARNPVLQFSGRHGEPEMNVQAVESVMDYQTQVGKHLPIYYVWLLDALKYGVGIVGHYWSEENIVTSKIEEETPEVFGIPIPGQKKMKKVVRQVPAYHGNRMFNVRPYDYRPDPRVPLNQPEKGEFNGRVVRLSVNEIKRRIISGQYIRENAEAAIARASRAASDRHDEGSAQLIQPTDDAGESNNDPSGLISVLHGHEMVVELVPRMWGLGSTEHPEKWVFTIVDKEIVIEAHPYGEMHQGYPFEVIESEIDGYSLFKRSFLDIARPLNDTMTWLFNSHFYNVRKSLNGEIIFDPSRLTAHDILDGGAGKRIRVRPAAYGQDIRTMYQVIQPDAAATQTHMRDMQIVEQLMQRVTGVNDGVLGAISQGGRKSATEVRSANTASIQRLKTITEYFSADGFTPLSQALLQTTQHNMDIQRKFRVAGDAINDAEQFMEVDAEKIAGFYDYVPVDGTLPVDRFAMVNMWSNMFAQLRNIPQVMQEYDMGKIFGHVAQLGGLKNIKQFKLQVSPDEEIIRQVQQGNVIALGGDNGGTGGGTPARNPSRGITGGGAPDGTGSELRVPEVTRAPGLGPTG